MKGRKEEMKGRKEEMKGKKEDESLVKVELVSDFFR